jgi:nucleotide-binding universal stress UspA family protein
LAKPQKGALYAADGLAAIFVQQTMKNILVLTGGGNSDESVFATAYAVAQPLAAHLEFFHVRLEPGEAAAWEPHSEFVRGPGVREMMQRLRADGDMRSAASKRNFDQLCKLHGITVTEEPRAGGGVSADWREEVGEAECRLVYQVRRHDMVIIGRRTGPNGLPPDVLEQVLLSGGRPLLVAPAKPARRPVSTVMVCWKETAEAARAVGAALPLLVKAERVVLLGVKERDPSLASGLDDLSSQLAWHGINADVDFRSSVTGSVREVLLSAIRSHDADLVVMGAYGHSRARQTIFGGFTHSVLESSEIAALLMH